MAISQEWKFFVSNFPFAFAPAAVAERERELMTKNEWTKTEIEQKRYKWDLSHEFSNSVVSINWVIFFSLFSERAPVEIIIGTVEKRERRRKRKKQSKNFHISQSSSSSSFFMFTYPSLPFLSPRGRRHLYRSSLEFTSMPKWNLRKWMKGERRRRENFSLLCFLTAERTHHWFWKLLLKWIRLLLPSLIFKQREQAIWKLENLFSNAHNAGRCCRCVLPTFRLTTHKIWQWQSREGAAAVAGVRLWDFKNNELHLFFLIIGSLLSLFLIFLGELTPTITFWMWRW